MENQLSIIVKESGLEETKANFLLEKFKDYFSIAAEWEKKAKTISVTDESQKVDMELARTGRLFLREKRIAIEKSRKELKEQSLREGKAIDGIANILKALIVPIENYLDQQEHFIELKKEREEELARIESERKAEEEKIAKEKAEAEERERIRLENEKLKAEAIEKQKALELERQKQQMLLDKERKQAEEKQKALEEKMRIEREKARKEKEKIEKQLKEKALAEQKALEEKQKVEEELKNLIKCPSCGHKFNLR